MTEKKIREIFIKSKNFSSKFEKYFDVYEEYFSKYKGKDIIFVEIGISNGGSLMVWREFFGPNARIIGIDLNPECKKFEKNGIEVFIGNQSDPKFWDNFFQTVGNVDIVLDDGGHTNLDQIITTVKCVDKIKDGGILLVEDACTSYIDFYNSNKKFSFVNFAKKIIDDVNFTFPFDNKNQFNYSLNKTIYSLHFYESIVIFNINRQKAIKNKIIKNQGTYHDIQDLYFQGNEIHIQNFNKIINKINFISLRKLTVKYKQFVNNKILKKFFN